MCHCALLFLVLFLACSRSIVVALLAQALPSVLRAAPPNSDAEIKSVLARWPDISPDDAMELLLPDFTNPRIRDRAAYFLNKADNKVRVWWRAGW